MKYTIRYREHGEICRNVIEAKNVYHAILMAESFLAQNGIKGGWVITPSGMATPISGRIR